MQLHDDTLAMLKARTASHGIGHGVGETLIFDNEYLVPPASKKTHALGSPLWQGSAFIHLFYEIDTGSKMTKDTFEQQVCKTLKASELFVTAMERKFGNNIVQSCMAWKQLKQDLRCKPSYRRAVSAALGQGVLFKDTLPEIKVILAQLEECKGKSGKSAAQTVIKVDAAVAEPSLLELNLEVARVAESRLDDDPNTAVAKSQALFSLSKMKIVKADVEATSELEALVDSGAKVLLVIIDLGACAPNSFGKQMDNLSKLGSVFKSLIIRLAAFVGPNLVLAGSCESSITSHFAQLGTYPVRLSNFNHAVKHSAGGLGKKKSRQQFVVNEWMIFAKQVGDGIPASEDFKVPISICDMPKKTRMVRCFCVRESCEYVKTIAPKSDLSQHMEQQDEDQHEEKGPMQDEFKSMIAEYEEADADEENYDQIEDDMRTPADKKFRVFTHGRDRKFWHHSLKTIVQPQTCSAVLVLTNTAQPSLPLACLDLGLPKIIVWQVNVKAHQSFHGDEELKRSLINVELGKLGIGRVTRKRTLMNDPQYINVTQLANNTSNIEFADVPVDWSAQWGGLDNCLLVDDKVASDLIREHSEACNLILSPSTVVGSKQGVFTKGAVSDGTSWDVPACWFSDERRLQSFLRMPGHQRFADRICRIKFVSGTFYAVLLGVFGELCHKDKANVMLKADHLAGPNIGAIAAVVKTKNWAGVAANTELCISYENESFDFNLGVSAADGNPPLSKQRRLDDFMKQGKGRDEVESNTQSQGSSVGDGDVQLWVLGSKELYKSCEGIKYADTAVAKVSPNTILWQTTGGTIRSESRAADEFGPDLECAIPLHLQSNTLIVFDDKVLSFEDGYKQALQQCDGALKLYQMFTTNIQSNQDALNRKLVLSQAHPLLILPPAGSPFRAIMESFAWPVVQNSKFAKIVTTWKIVQQIFLPNGLAMVAMRVVMTGKGRQVIIPAGKQ